MSNPPEAASYCNSIKLLILLPLRAIYFYSLYYETPCTYLKEAQDNLSLDDDKKMSTSNLGSLKRRSSTSERQAQKVTECSEHA